MRFEEGGPTIPDELLIARDEGRVVFFVGAGTSVARARLPDFSDLAQQVLLALEGVGDSPSKRLMHAAREFERTSGLRGLIPSDRIFSILERDFEIRHVHAAVAKALKPAAAVDVTAHRILLNLARGPDDRTRLVTTNFDLLFEVADPKLASWLPGRLPNPQNHEELDGIIHIHGRVNKDYAGADGDGFVLSSAEFGRAYISQGWATRFIASILKKYLVVFVGYTADDPPVQYLLEALNREPGSNSGLFAFQAGSHMEAEGRWLHKGVQPISYDDREHHKALWTCLEAWATRARDVSAWYETVITAAKKGPAELAPHERGQVQHVVSTLDGARLFAAGDKPPPAEWLCVFDRASRFAPPGRVYNEADEQTIVDPFEAYGLDSDPVPPKGDPENPIPNRDIPSDAWHCFELTRLDRDGLQLGHFAAFRGSGAIHPAWLAPRLEQIGTWLSKVSEQPAAVWWASARAPLHSNLQLLIRSHLGRQTFAQNALVRKAWRYLFEAWASSKDAELRDRFDLRVIIKRDGWSSAVVRQFAALHQPHFSAERPFRHGPRPPTSGDEVTLSSLSRLDVEYPKVDTADEIPDDLLRIGVRAWRGVIERAVLLEGELNPYALDRFAPLMPEAQEPGHDFTHGIAAPIAYYVKLLRRLIALDPAAARHECISWWTDDDAIFARLRIWACGEQAVFASEDVGKILSSLGEQAFWSHGHQPDLLIVLAQRWPSFSAASRGRLAERLLAGPARRDDEEEPSFAERRAWSSLERIHWLSSQGCDLGFDVEQEIARLSPLAPKWKREYSQSVIKSWAPRFGSVGTDSEYSALLSVPRSAVLARAQELSAQRTGMDVQKDPFAGLAGDRPLRALSALTLARRGGTDPVWAWTTFLHAQARQFQEKKSEEQKKSPREVRLLNLIAARLTKLPMPTIGELIHPIADWLLSATVPYAVEVQQLDSLWPLVITALRDAPERQRSNVHEREPDWATEALNSPAGKFAQALMADPRKVDAIPAGGFAEEWLQRVEALLALDGDARRHALAIFSYNLNWFYARDADWTERHLLAAAEREADVSAFWAGVLWAANIPRQSLYLRLKAALLGLERQSWIVRHSHQEILAAFILAGWRGADATTGETFISNDEMRTQLLNASEDFRAQLLWQLERWSEDPEGEWTPSILRSFLVDAWPRQKIVKTGRTSARLCELAFTSAETLGEIADVVIELTTKSEDSQLSLYELTQSPEKIVDKFPEKTLALLSTVLSSDVRRWPYGIESVLDRIGIADPTLLKDGRLIELHRTWNAR